jgi:hypothetical protein
LFQYFFDLNKLQIKSINKKKIFIFTSLSRYFNSEHTSYPQKPPKLSEQRRTNKTLNFISEYFNCKNMDLVGKKYKLDNQENFDQYLAANGKYFVIKK